MKRDLNVWIETTTQETYTHENPPQKWDYKKVKPQKRPIRMKKDYKRDLHTHEKRPTPCVWCRSVVPAGRPKTLASQSLYWNYKRYLCMWKKTSKETYIYIKRPTYCKWCRNLSIETTKETNTYEKRPTYCKWCRSVVLAGRLKTLVSQSLYRDYKRDQHIWKEAYLLYVMPQCGAGGTAKDTRIAISLSRRQKRPTHMKRGLLTLCDAAVWCRRDG